MREASLDSPLQKAVEFEQHRDARKLPTTDHHPKMEVSQARGISCPRKMKAFDNTIAALEAICCTGAQLLVDRTARACRCLITAQQQRSIWLCHPTSGLSATCNETKTRVVHTGHASNKGTAGYHENYQVACWDENSCVAMGNKKRHRAKTSMVSTAEIIDLLDPQVMEST